MKALRDVGIARVCSYMEFSFWSAKALTYSLQRETRNQKRLDVAFSINAELELGCSNDASEHGRIKNVSIRDRRPNWK